MEKEKKALIVNIADVLKELDERGLQVGKCTPACERV
jgi:hypothetical protein